MAMCSPTCRVGTASTRCASTSGSLVRGGARPPEDLRVASHRRARAAAAKHQHPSSQHGAAVGVADGVAAAPEAEAGRKEARRHEGRHRRQRAASAQNGESECRGRVQDVQASTFLAVILTVMLISTETISKPSVPFLPFSVRSFFISFFSTCDSFGARFLVAYFSAGPPLSV